MVLLRSGGRGSGMAAGSTLKLTPGGLEGGYPSKSQQITTDAAPKAKGQYRRTCQANSSAQVSDRLHAR